MSPNKQAGELRLREAPEALLVGEHSTARLLIRVGKPANPHVGAVAQRSITGPQRFHVELYSVDECLNDHVVLKAALRLIGDVAIVRQRFYDNIPENYWDVYFIGHHCPALLAGKTLVRPFQLFTREQLRAAGITDDWLQYYGAKFHVYFPYQGFCKTCKARGHPKDRCPRLVSSTHSPAPPLSALPVSQAVENARQSHHGTQRGSQSARQRSHNGSRSPDHRRSSSPGLAEVLASPERADGTTGALQQTTNSQDHAQADLAVSGSSRSMSPPFSALAPLQKSAVRSGNSRRNAEADHTTDSAQQQEASRGVATAPVLPAQQDAFVSDNRHESVSGSDDDLVLRQRREVADEVRSGSDDEVSGTVAPLGSVIPVDSSRAMPNITDSQDTAYAALAVPGSSRSVTPAPASPLPLAPLRPASVHQLDTDHISTRSSAMGAAPRGSSAGNQDSIESVDSSESGDYSGPDALHDSGQQVTDASVLSGTVDSSTLQRQKVSMALSFKAAVTDALQPHFKPKPTPPPKVITDPRPPSAKKASSGNRQQLQDRPASHTRSRQPSSVTPNSR